jgi:glyoxylase-like metal-dependent hydrolase (beta-lactamase superfamily II)
MKQSDDNRFIPMTSVNSNAGKEVGADLYCYTNQIVNLVMIGKPDDAGWVLIDTGMPGCGKEIEEAAYDRFGAGRKPLAIVLTHGHFDHVGNIVYLLEKWDVPVFAHPAEFPFLTGLRDYPEPDAGVEGGLLAKIASIYPYQAIDIKEKLMPLSWDGTLPFLPDWRWIPTPGHSPGQVAIFRQQDGVLLSADAFITVRQDSFYKVLLQKKEVNGPPRYFTTDWHTAYLSVLKLRDLHPQVVIPGHGAVMEGDELASGLDHLVEYFGDFAKPDYGKFT